MGFSRPLAGLIPFDFDERTRLYFRRVTAADIEAFRTWRAAHTEATGLDGYSWVVCRLLVDPETGGRLFTDVSELGDLSAVAVIRIGKAALRLCAPKWVKPDEVPGG